MLPVGHLPVEIAYETGVKHPIVYLSKDSIRHILERHPDLAFEDLLLLSDVVQRGEIILENKQKPSFLYLYWSIDRERPFSMAVKYVRQESELLIVSFRRTDRANLRALRERGPRLRDHIRPLVVGE